MVTVVLVTKKKLTKGLFNIQYCIWFLTAEAEESHVPDVLVLPFHFTSKVYRNMTSPPQSRTIDVVNLLSSFLFTFSKDLDMKIANSITKLFR